LTLRGSAAAICLAAAALSCLALTAAEPAAAKPSLTINIPEPDVDLGDRTVVRGQLHDVNPSASQRVVLLGREFPYKRERVVAGTYTGTSGTYFFRVRPTLNTRYRVRFQSTFSDVRRVWVFPVRQRTFVSDEAGIARARFFIVFPPDYPLALSGRRITWYFRKDGNPIYRSIARSRSRSARDPRRMTGRVRFRLPESPDPYSYFVTWCFKLGREGQDIGIGRNAGGGCPRRFRDTD
jgi:hypothetical protein